MSDQDDILIVETLERHRPVSKAEICSQCHINEALLEALIEHGVVDVDTPMRFHEAHVIRVTRAVRVMHEFDVGLDNLALVVELLDKLQQQRREIAQLRKFAMLD